MTMSGKVQGGERKRTTSEVSKQLGRCQNWSNLLDSRISPRGTCLLLGRHPA